MGALPDQSTDHEIEVGRLARVIGPGRSVALAIARPEEQQVRLPPLLHGDAESPRRVVRAERPLQSMEKEEDGRCLGGGRANEVEDVAVGRIPALGAGVECRGVTEELPPDGGEMGAGEPPSRTERVGSGRSRTGRSVGRRHGTKERAGGGNEGPRTLADGAAGLAADRNTKAPCRCGSSRIGSCRNVRVWLEERPGALLDSTP